MGKETRVKKNTDGDGSPSTSTLSALIGMSQEQNHRIQSDNKIERGNSSKKMYIYHSSSILNPPGKVEAPVSGSGVNKVSMENLPPEMLMEVLSYMDSRTLFKVCRLVNRKWSEISSAILCNRPTTPKTFQFGTKWGTDEDPISLKEFLQCMKKSKNCPFSHFRVSSSQVKMFENEHWIDFLADFSTSNPNQKSQKIKSLELKFLFIEGVDTVKILAEKLGDCLLNKIPRLEKLSLDFSWCVERAPNVKLFPTTEQQPNAAPIKIQLPHLKFLHLDSLQDHFEIAKDLLNAAVNLKQLDVATTSSETFQVLLSLRKLHLLKKAFITIDGYFFFTLEQIQRLEQEIHQQPPQLELQPMSSPNCPQPKLQILHLGIQICESDQRIQAPAAIFLTNLFESSKNTLKELTVQSWTFGFGSFPNFQLPTFNNLNKLSLSHVNFNMNNPFFPPGTREKNIFPNVNYLDLTLHSQLQALPREDSIPRLPNLKTVTLVDSTCTENVISMLALMCPTFKKLKIYNDNNLKLELIFIQVARSIWTQLSQLESLEIDINVNVPENNHYALDSCFTGISAKNCRRLYKATRKFRKGKTRVKMSKISPIFQSKLKIMAEREFPSILDMKYLTTLTVNAYSKYKLLESKDFFTQKLTWISDEYAFNFLPHLKPAEEKNLE